jgi:hypothetical protein
LQSAATPATGNTDTSKWRHYASKHALEPKV